MQQLTADQAEYKTGFFLSFPMQSFCCRNENRCWAACFSQFCRKSPLAETPALLGSEAPSCLPLCLQSRTVLNPPCVWHSRGLPKELCKGNPGEHSPGSPQQEQAVGCPREGWGQPHTHLGEQHGSRSCSPRSPQGSPAPVLLWRGDRLLRAAGEHSHCGGAQHPLLAART